MASADQIVAALALAADLARITDERTQRKLTTTVAQQRTIAKSVATILEGVDVGDFLRAFTPRPIPPVDSTAPTTPGSLATIMAGSSVALSWTASTDNVGVVFYEVWRRLTAGSYGASALATSPTNAYVDASVAVNTGYTYRVYAVDAAGNRSSASNESAITTPNTSTADVTAPPVPGQPASATIDNVALTYTTTWSAVTDTGPGGTVISGTRRYQVLEDGAHADYADHPVTLAAELARDIGAPSVTGSDSGTVLTAGGVNPSGSSDQRYMKTRSVQGDFSVYLDVSSVASTPVTSYPKVMLAAYGSTDPSAQRFEIVVFPSGTIAIEYRDVHGDIAGQQVTAAITFPMRLRLTKTGKTFLAEYSTNAGANYSTLGSRTIQTFPSVFEVGRAGTMGQASGFVSMAYTNYTFANATTVTYVGRGVASQSKSVTVKSEDFAGNISAASTGRTVTFSSGATVAGSGLAMSLIGGNRALYASQSFLDYYRFMRLGLLGLWDGTQALWGGMTLGQIVDYIEAHGGKTAMYWEQHFPATSSPGGVDNEQHANYNTYQRWLYQVGTSGTRVSSFYDPSKYLSNRRRATMLSLLDNNGENIFQADAKYAYDFLFKGGALGRSNGGNGANNCKYICYDDMLYKYGTGGAVVSGAYDKGPTRSGADSQWWPEFRKGQVESMTQGQVIDPTIELVGNVSQAQSADSAANDTEFRGLLSIGINETIVAGELQNAPDTWGGGLVARQALLDGWRWVKTNGWLVMGQQTLNSNGSDALDSAVMRAAMYGLCMGRVVGGDRCLVNQQIGYGNDCALQFWMDEYAISAAGVVIPKATALANGTGKGYLGLATSGEILISQVGVYMRLYQRGIAFWNPRGNGPRQFPLGGSITYKKPSGGILNSSNNGQVYTPASIISLADRDGAILLTV